MSPFKYHQHPAFFSIKTMQKLRNLLKTFSVIPLAGWLLGALAAALLEYYLGDRISCQLFLPKIPVLFGTLIMLKDPTLIPSVLGYDLIIYIIPILLVARLSAGL
ncbi:MAG: hypothetical protein D3904_12420, partial [Candidatus Electrothrix sp. EH2]|nr:hypothetical protein [Candidatus Electrothrix sp. EH2]